MLHRVEKHVNKQMAMAKRPKPLPLDPSEIPEKERGELLRNFLRDPEARKRAAERYADGLVEDAAKG